jgi:hypothetical protein
VDLTRQALDADLHVADTRDPTELGEWLSARIDELLKVSGKLDV